MAQKTHRNLTNKEFYMGACKRYMNLLQKKDDFLVCSMCL